ncbi:MAG TPA: LysR family transcriptional regulator [Plantibacter sp.]|uniref:LysR family transcriptional regulator n=1 Tax=unclassified Plantibacter TaxID=2624265 RepID=UPI002C5BFEF0|nr:LysR family transcriptional regulator [Plantibacter sp.]
MTHDLHRQLERDAITLRQLRSAVVVADARTLGVAANLLGVAQPSLAQQLRRLEAAIGVEIFSVLGDEYRPTREGQRFLLKARTFIDVVADMDPQAPARHIRVGRPPTTWDAVVTEVGHRIDVPAVAVAIEPVEQLHLVTTGRLDATIVRLPIDLPDGLQAEEVAALPLGVVMRAQHPLTTKDSIEWSDLADQELLRPEPGKDPAYSAWLAGALASRGWYPRSLTIDAGNDTLFLDALRFGERLVALRPVAAMREDDGLAWRPLADAPELRERFALVTRRE